MPNFNQLLTLGDIDQGIINTVIEIPEGSFLKIEYQRTTGTFAIDRVEPSIFAKPANYGFIPQTLDDDGDELDTLVVCEEPIPTGIHLQGKVIGILNFQDDGEMDHKVILVPIDDRNTGNRINSIEDLGQRWKDKIEFHFNHYKDLKKPGITKVLGWGNTQEAIETIKECSKRYASSQTN
jgi:inorganic pyrophosphatase